MSIQCNKGFVIDYIRDLRISSKDAKKYGIQDDFATYDINKDGDIDCNEFLSGGISNSKIFSAFASLAGDNYSKNFEDTSFNDDKELKSAKEHKGEISLASNQNIQNNRQRKAYKTDPLSFGFQQKYNLTHPNIDKEYLAEKIDFLA